MQTVDCNTIWKGWEHGLNINSGEMGVVAFYVVEFHTSPGPNKTHFLYGCLFVIMKGDSVVVMFQPYQYHLISNT